MDPLTLLVSSLSLAISFALAVREFAIRPIPLGWVEIAHQYWGEEWIVIGYRLNIANVGRRHIIVAAMGVQTTAADGVSGAAGSFTWLPDQPPVENAEGPFSLAPGDVHLYLLPAEQRGDATLPLVAQIVQRNPWRFLPGRARTRRKLVVLGNTKP